MYCRKCNILVDCKSSKCPLCHGELSIGPLQTKEEEPDINKRLEKEKEVAFPQGKITRFRPDRFTRIFFIVFVLTSLICEIVNVIVDPNFMWSIIYIIVMWYLFYCVRFTVFAQGNFHIRIFGQVVVITILSIIARLVFGGNEFLFSIWLPITYFVGELLIGVYALIYFKEARKKMISILVLCILGWIPLVAALIIDVTPKWPAIVATAFSVVEIIVTLIIGRKHFIGELKRFFHI